MARKFSYAAFAALGIVLAGGASWWLQSRPAAANAGGDKAVTAKTGASEPAGERVAGVEVAHVVVKTLRDDAQAVGSLRARQSVMLRPELVGRITALNFRDGGPVRKGQILVQFDDQLQVAEVKQMQAQLAIAQANYKRTQELVSANFMSQQTLDTAAANLQVAQAQLGLSQARLTRMAVQAPFDGTAGIRLVNVGDYVKDGVDLVPLEDTRQMLVDFRLPERYGSKVKPGQGVEVTLDALPGRSFMATVEAVDPLMDANGRSVGVRALISGAGTSGAQATVLRSGMFARVTTVFSVNDAALVVPEEAIVPQGNRQLVYKLLPPDAGATVPTDVKWVARRQEVKLGVRGRGVVEIVDGLKAGDTVVVAGQQRLQKDGSPVRIVELGRPGDKTGDAASANSADVPVKGQAGPASR